MNIYYTAKDIEELAAKGIFELELGSNSSLTDFARETAEQLGVTLLLGAQELVDGSATRKAALPPSLSSQPDTISQRYNKPRGCQGDVQFAQSGPSSVEAVSPNQSSSTPMNRLVDMMGKIINRGD
jgi:hypothetical protein